MTAQRRRPIWRWTWRLTLALLLGALTTVGVAWWLATKDIPVKAVVSEQQIVPRRGPVTAPDGMDLVPNSVSVSVYECAGRAFYSAVGHGESSLGFVGTSMLAPSIASSLPPDELVPGWAGTWSLPWLHDKPLPSSGQHGDRTEVFASGWPMLAFFSVRDTPRDGPTRLRFGTELDRDNYKRAVGEDWYVREKSVVLPYHPIYLGFAVNTLLGAGVWFTLLFAPGAIYRALRRPKWACRGCNYDRRGLPDGAVCPECGAPGPAKSSPGASS